MEIRNVQHPTHAATIDPGGERQPRAARQGESAGDRVDISAAGRRAARVGQLVRRVLDLPEVRPPVVDAARRALESGDLDTQAAIEATVRAITRPE